MTETHETVRVFALASAEMQPELRRQLAPIGTLYLLNGRPSSPTLRVMEPLSLALLPRLFRIPTGGPFGEASLSKPRPPLLVYTHTANFQLCSGVLESRGSNVIFGPFPPPENRRGAHRAGIRGAAKKKTKKEYPRPPPIASERKRFNRVSEQHKTPPRRRGSPPPKKKKKKGTPPHTKKGAPPPPPTFPRGAAPPPPPPAKKKPQALFPRLPEKTAPPPPPPHGDVRTPPLGNGVERHRRLLTTEKEDLLLIRSHHHHFYTTPLRSTVYYVSPEAPPVFSSLINKKAPLTPPPVRGKKKHHSGCNSRGRGAAVVRHQRLLEFMGGPGRGTEDG